MVDDPQDSDYPHWMSLTLGEANTQGQVDTIVEGTIPKWLSGTLYRNGAGVYDVKDTHIRHFFDGFSVLHKFSIDQGHVTYASSLLDSSSLEEAMGSSSERLVPTSQGLTSVVDPCKAIFKGSQVSYFAKLPAEKTDNTAVNVVEFGDGLYALTETATVNRIDRDSLKRTTCIDMTETVAVHTGSAHPHFSRDGLTMFSYGTNFNHTKAYNIIAIDLNTTTTTTTTTTSSCDNNDPKDNVIEPFQNGRIVASVPSRWPSNISYNHSFGMSDRYFVVLDQPVTFNTRKFQISHVDRQGVTDTLAIRKGESLQFRLIDRRTNKAVKVTYETDPAFVFHFVNCYEEGDPDGDGFLVVDVIIYHRIQAINDLYLESLRKSRYRIPDAGSFARFVLPLNLDNVPRDFNLVTLPNTKATAVWEFDNANTVTVTPDFLNNEKIVMELPRINYKRCAGRRYRYVYGNSIFSDYCRACYCYHELVKLDTQSGNLREWTAGPEFYPGEPIFVPSPEGDEEDDGVILSPVLSQTPDHASFLVIIDATSFTELARANIPRDLKVSMTFHGSFSQQLSPTRDKFDSL